MESAFICGGDKPNSVPAQLPAPEMIISLDPLARTAARLATCWCDYYPGAALPKACARGRAGQAARLPVLSCTAWGLSCPGTCVPGGGLLLRLFTLTRDLRRGRFVFCDTFHRAGLASNASACSTRHAALWCSDFPLPARAGSDHLPPRRICRGRRPWAKAIYAADFKIEATCRQSYISRLLWPNKILRKAPRHLPVPACSCFLRWVWLWRLWPW